MRKAISKKLRFEIFKRDSFSCRYCGRQAPAVILQVDHINPVAKGGDNNPLNLATSCFDCNSGKSDRILSDNSAITIQRNQSKILAEKNLQIEMIAQWYKEISNLDAKIENIVRDEVNKNLSQSGYKIADSFFNSEYKKMIKKYPLDLILLSINAAAESYIKDSNDTEQLNNFLNKIPKVCYWKNEERKNPELAEFRKLTYMAKRHWWNCNVNVLLVELLALKKNHSIDIEVLTELIIGTKGILEFRDAVSDYLGANNV